MRRSHQPSRRRWMTYRIRTGKTQAESTPLNKTANRQSPITAGRSVGNPSIGTLTANHRSTRIVPPRRQPFVSSPYSLSSDGDHHNSKPEVVVPVLRVALEAFAVSVRMHRRGLAQIALFGVGQRRVEVVQVRRQDVQVSQEQASVQALAGQQVSVLHGCGQPFGDGAAYLLGDHAPGRVGYAGPSIAQVEVF
jgi:hypothetical protein